MLEPVGVPDDISRGNGVLPRKRRIPNDCVETGVVPLEHLRELDLPMKRRKRRIRVPPLGESAAVALGLAAHDNVGVFASLALALLGLLPSEEGSEHEIAEEPNFGDLKLGLVPEVT